MMKKLQVLLTGLIISVTAFAQIPNSGFETWLTLGSYENPDGWGTMNNTTAFSGIYTATKGVPGSPGSSYLVLTSSTVGTAVVNGIACSGVLDTITKTPKSGFAYAARPQKFTGKWQHMIYGSSQGAVSVTLTRWNSLTNARETVASASQTLSGMAMSWANFSLTLTYQNGNTPDSCIIFLKASGTNPTQDDYLWVDNLAFTGTVVGIDSPDELSNKISVFPNPVNCKLEISFSDLNMEGNRVLITDILGRSVFVKEITSQNLTIETEKFSEGMYLYNVLSSNNSLIHKGKFTVLH